MPSTMRAIRFHHYGSADELKLETLPVPTPAAGEVLVQVRAAAMNPVDWKVRSGKLKILVKRFDAQAGRGSGSDFAGEIVGLGAGVDTTAWPVGTRVFGSLDFRLAQGAMSEFVTIDAGLLGRSPASPAWDDAAVSTLPVAAGTALYTLADVCGLRAGGNARVAITGAAGGVGAFAVQIAKHFGAQVTAVCSAGNAAYAQALGATRVIDYRQSDFTQLNEQFDLIFDAATTYSFARCQRILAPQGQYANPLPTPGMMAKGAWLKLTSKQRLHPIMLKRSAGLWARLSEMAQSGVIGVPPLQRIALDDVAGLQAAHRASETGHGSGKTVVVP